MVDLVLACSFILLMIFAVRQARNIPDEASSTEATLVTLAYFFMAMICFSRLIRLAGIYHFFFFKR
jgi:hypothetical protein